MSRYAISDISLAVWGEGSRAGTLGAVIKFAGCPFWESGKPHDRASGPLSCADYCDARMKKGRVYSGDDLIFALDQTFAKVSASARRWVVLTGGEPTAQTDRDLLLKLNAAGYFIHLETSGAFAIEGRENISHVAVSPKLSREGEPAIVRVERPDEVRVIFPGGWGTDGLDALAEFYSDPDIALYLVPLDPLIRPSEFVGSSALTGHGVLGAEEETTVAIMKFSRNLQACLKEIERNPMWRLGLQTHKVFPLGKASAGGEDQPR